MISLPISGSNPVSLSLRGLLCYNNQSHQGVNPHLLPPSLPNTNLSNPVLVRPDLRCCGLLCVQCCGHLPMSPGILCLEQKPTWWKVHQLQLGDLGQWRIQHTSGPSHHRPAYLRSSKAAAWTEEEDGTIHYVWTWRFVSRPFILPRKATNPDSKLTFVPQCLHNFHGPSVHYQNFRFDGRPNLGQHSNHVLDNNGDHNGNTVLLSSNYSRRPPPSVPPSLRFYYTCINLHCHG